jgi:ABC-2 type transport system ATP-binding protein
VLIYKLIKYLLRRRAERRAAKEPPASSPTARPRPTAATGTPTSCDAAISVRGLRKSYDGHEAVQGVDFDVERGEILAFLGPNGAGKTTCVEILEGYRGRSAGEVRVLGEDPARASPSWRASVGVVLQESRPEPYLTARECLELFAGYFPRPRPIDETLELVGLAAQADTLTTKLSGGQQRRLDVALALIGDPELVFLDEPTTGFDPSARRSAWRLVAGLRELGKTIFLTTHYLEEAEFLADRIIVIADGTILAEGTPATLGGRDRSAARITFTLPDGVALEQLPPPFRESEIAGGRVVHRTTNPLQDLRTLSDWALEAGIDLPDIEVRRPTLEDVYLELIGAAA